MAKLHYLSAGCEIRSSLRLGSSGQTFLNVFGACIPQDYLPIIRGSGQRVR